MIIKFIKWQQTLPIRHQVLWPAKTEEFCKVAGDENALHFAVFDNNGKIQTVASIFDLGEKIQLRKFATLSASQGKGFGTFMLNQLLKYFQQSSHKVFCLDARESAVGFYQRFGFEICSERFFKQDVPYFKMQILK